jgi:hypothetical protein
VLLRNDGAFRFHDLTAEAGLADYGFAWGAVFEDMNLDGRLDLLVSQNYVKWPVHAWFKFPGKLLLAGASAAEFFPDESVENPAFSNSPVIADLDGDTRPDLFWLNNDGPSRAYLNRTEANRVSVALPDAVSAQGARVWLEGAAPRYVREVASSSGLGADQSSELTFGLGAGDRVERLVVAWPDGRTAVVENPPLNRRILLAPPAPLAPVGSAR